MSTLDQNPQNQLGEIAAAGFQVAPHRVVTEMISGSMSIEQRKGFARLLDKMEQGDVLVVTKLDRLGRDAIDVSTTVAKLEDFGIRVHCLALGGVDLTSSAGKLTMGVINAVAQFGPIGRFLRRTTLRKNFQRTQSGSPVSGWPDVQWSRNFAVCGSRMPIEVAG